MLEAGLLKDPGELHENAEVLDVILVSGDALVDHPSFGTALVARFLQSLGLSVGVIAQPDWRNPRSVAQLGRARLFFGVSSGNLDSMLHHYTAARKKRHDDPYSPGGRAGLRPNRAVIVYANLIRSVWKDAPVILGGMEASLRRLAHYDYWEDAIRRSILLDSRADCLVYGNAENALAEIVQALRAGRPLAELACRGTVVVRPAMPDAPFLELPSFEMVSRDPLAFARMTRDALREINAPTPRILVQAHGNRFVWHMPPQPPLTEAQLDALYALPFTRREHPMYGKERVLALETVRHSIVTHRGCFGGCAFCALSYHQGGVIQSRSIESIAAEAERICRDPSFRGTITDVGGPSANMYGAFCGKNPGGRGCSRLSCLWPKICPHLHAGPEAILALWRRLRGVRGVRRIFVASGIRMDLANRHPEYIRELVQHHTGGHLKVAPEHTADDVLSRMRKPPLKEFLDFLRWFDLYRPPQIYLVPYFMSSHPGCEDKHMRHLAEFLHRRRMPVEQAQDFIPIPGTLASAMYHAGVDPETMEPIPVEKSDRGKLRQRQFLSRHELTPHPKGLTRK